VVIIKRWCGKGGEVVVMMVMMARGDDNIVAD
jgi:hypothetical protein